ncbi:MAG: Na+/H+ antiporter subunit E [Lentisphaeria bacterium]|nr:Na+/H+ antiporter subunit E [Lentisphaeria bacterium]
MQKIITFFTLMFFWFLFSGKTDYHLWLFGTISCLIVTFISADLMYQKKDQSLGSRLTEALRAIKFILWLLIEIIKSNIYILKLAFSPNLLEKIEPKVIAFETTLKSDFARYVLANAITLTPGTVTVDIDGDTFHVHAISNITADSLPGKMQEKVAEAFEERDE